MANCTPVTGPLDADNDMVGYGALAAFLATATITYFTVIYAYVSDALDRDMLNPLDERVIHFTRRALASMGPKPRAQKQHDPHRGEDEDPGRDARRQALDNFLMSLSDQQLVTGLAVLIAAVAGQSYLSGFEFSVALGLGWFSCTTHLATLEILCTRFRSHGIIRDVRVLGIICLLALLSYVFVVSVSTDEYTVPMVCSPRLLYLQDFITLLPLWSDYFNAIQSLYLGPHLGPFDLITRLHRRLRHQPSLTLGEVIATKIERRSKDIEEMAEKSPRGTASLIGFYYYDGSFLETFPDMTYSFSYGITQIVADRWVDAPALSEDATSIGYGQITTLILLALPFLAIGEAYSEYRQSLKMESEQPETSSQHSSIAMHSLDAGNPAGDVQVESPLSSPIRVPSSANAAQDPPFASHDGSATEPANPRPSQGRHPQLSNRSLPFAALRGIHTTLADLSAVEYDRSIPEIKAYFPLEVHRLSSIDEAATLEREKIILLRRFSHVRHAEQSFKPATPLMLFTGHLLLGVAGGVLLNIRSSGISAIGIACSICLVALNNMKYLQRLVLLVRRHIRKRRSALADSI